MTTFDRYLFLEWLKVFLLSFFVTLGILLLEDIYDDLPDLLGYGASSLEVLRYYVAIVPSFLPVVLPVGLMISILFTLSGLHRRHEIVAIRAAGLNIFQITRVLWVMGVVVAAGLFWLNAHTVPWSIQETRQVREHFRFRDEIEKHGEDRVGLLSKFAYDNQQDRRIWFMNSFSEYTYQGFGVSVYVRNASGEEVQRIIAREAYYDDADHHWVFLNGREVTYDPASGDPIRSLPFEQKSYPGFTEDPILMQTLSQRPDDLSLFELKSVLDKGIVAESPALRPYAIRYQSIWVSPLNCLVVVCLAIPFAVSGVRKNPMVGVSKCVGLFFAYYFIVNIFRLLGEQGTLNLTLSAWLPIILVFGFACWLYRRVL